MKDSTHERTRLLRRRLRQPAARKQGQYDELPRQGFAEFVSDAQRIDLTLPSGRSKQAKVVCTVCAYPIDAPSDTSPTPIPPHRTETSEDSVSLTIWIT